MKKNVFWLTYDLGIDGDYDGLYAWLDGVKARECGDSACYFAFDTGASDPAKGILSGIKRKARLRPKDRLYLIWRKSNGAITGRFIAGLRHRAPWAGYAIEATEEGEDAA